MDSCKCCGADLPVLRYRGNPRKWCSESCRMWAHHHPGERRPTDWVPNKSLPRKICPRCQAQFHPRQHNIVYCTRGCAYAARSEHYAALRTAGCRTGGCPNSRSVRMAWCGPCARRRWPEDPEKVKARNRRKTHIRKAKTRRSDVSLDYERRLRANVRRCPLCRVYMTGKPYLPKSKELDHIVPLNVGGTHTVGNVRIICRTCNIRRPRDGSDYRGPVTLFALEVA